MRERSSSILACRTSKPSVLSSPRRRTREGTHLAPSLLALVLLAPGLGLVVAAELAVLDDLAHLDELVDGERAPNVCTSGRGVSAVRLRGSTEGTRGKVLTVGVLGDVRRRVFEHGELRGGAERQEVGDERVVGVAEVDNGLRGGRRSQLADYWAEWKGSGTYRPSVAQEGEAHRAERGRRVGRLEAVQQRVRAVHR